MITLEPAAGDNRPFPVRLRRILKSLLRSHGCRCVAITTGYSSKQNGAAVPAKEADRPVRKVDAPHVKQR
jgi:hypothetical protein